MKKLIDLKSGHRLTLNIASLEAGQELVSVLTEQLRNVRLDISRELLLVLLQDDEDATKKKAAMVQAVMGNDANTVWNTFLVLIGSRDLRTAIYRCMATCMLNAAGVDEGIVPNSFAPEGARRDFYPVAWEVAKANLLPFFEDLLSGLSIPAKLAASSQK